MSARPSCRGYTLLELVIAISIGTLVFLLVGALAKTAVYSFDHLSRTQRVDHDLKRAIAEIERDLKAASISGTTIDTSDPDYDLLALQVVDPDGGTGSLTWGYPDSSNTFQPDWSCEYRVVNDALVRRVFDAFGNAIGSDAVLCVGVDRLFLDNGTPSKGFSVTAVGPLYSVRLRVREVFRNGTDYRRTEQTALFLVNP